MGANNSTPAVYDGPAYVLLVLDLVLTSSALLARVASRRIMKATPAVDDYLAYSAYVGYPRSRVEEYLLMDERWPTLDCSCPE